MLHLIITILLGITTIFFGTVLFYSLRRINNYEQIILNISSTIDLIKHQLKIIDDKGSFEADDEVGFFFQEIKHISHKLEQIFETEVDDGNQEKEKKEK